MATTTINVTNQLQDLQSVTDEGNITTNDINLDNSALILENSSRLQSGTIDNGAGGGIARVCSIGYQDEWENGVQYFISQNSNQIVWANSINNTIPDANFDITMGYVPGSIFFDMNNQNKYQCTDNTDAAAVWVPFTEQIQSDWNQSDNTQADYIKNKPTIPSTLNYGLFAQTANSPTITGTTSELTLIDGGVGSLSVPANGFSVGDSFRLDMGGVMSAQNNNTITIRLKSGAVSLGSSGPLTMPAITNQVWFMTTTFTVRSIGAAGVASIVALTQFHILKLASGTQQGFAWNTVNSTTFDTTIGNTLNITAQWSSNNANNSIYSDIFTLSKTY
ncbi:hypothetical protein UFOVP775_48 [uncultured Caudovirales phage]|uniref:Uncharacterized protein n=1 Tax=uncultured Caudovirales phage TaxID=2100421 RepID=A0A6J5NU49_9CAUD|nr:hypothetical protein UFOVP775_48 [uncultured Caudovirales phage]